MNSGRQHNDKDSDTFFKTQIAFKDIEYILDIIYDDAETISYEKPPGTYEVFDINDAFR